MEDNLIENELQDEPQENYEKVILVAANGDEIEFNRIANIGFDDRLFTIMQPTQLFPEMEEDEALVFEVLDTGGAPKLNLVSEAEIIYRVFEEYNKLLDSLEEGNGDLN